MRQRKGIYGAFRGIGSKTPVGVVFFVVLVLGLNPYVIWALVDGITGDLMFLWPHFYTTSSRRNTQRGSRKGVRCIMTLFFFLFSVNSMTV